MLAFTNTTRSDPSPTFYKFRPHLYGIAGFTTGVNLWNPTAAYDGREDPMPPPFDPLSSCTYFNYGKGPADLNYYEVKNLQLPSPWTWVDWGPPDIVKVDFKMKYWAELNDKAETYQIEFYVGAVGPVVLVAHTGAEHANITETWADQPEPTNGVWDWADIPLIKFRVTVSKKAGSSMDSYFYEWEAWVEITVEPHVPTPAEPWPKLAVDPEETAKLSIGQTFSVDVAITDIVGLYAYQYNLTYDPDVLTYTSAYSYPPFTMPLGPGVEVNDAVGYVAISYAYPFGELTGLWGGGDLSSITFTVESDGGSILNILNATEDAVFSSKLSGVYGENVQHWVFDGVYYAGGVVPEFPLGMALELTLIVAVAYIWWRRKSKIPRRTTRPQSIS